MKSIFLNIIIPILVFGQSMDLSPKLFPGDESNLDESFLSYKSELLKAIAKKDVAFIIKSLDEEVMSSFGGDGGVEEFKENWELNNSESEFWKEINTVMSMGGSFIDDEENIFAAPYVYSKWPEEYDVFENIAVIDSSVNMYEKQDIQSEVIKILSFDILKIEYEWPENSIWSKIETYSGEKGFVLNEKLRSPIDYRIGFQKEKNNWKIVWFVAGD